MTLYDRRSEYAMAGLEIDELDASPISQWHLWYQQAVEAEIVEPNAMTISTVDSKGAPDSRIVLVREVDDKGFVFYTNYRSPKSTQLLGHSDCCAVFGWLELQRQVRIKGSAEKVSAAQSDQYFASRPRESQLGAWASPQSEIVNSREQILDRLAERSLQFEGGEVPRPPDWGGWRIKPQEIEFWQGRPSRLHDRFVYSLHSGLWKIQRLAP